MNGPPCWAAALVAVALVGVPTTALAMGPSASVAPDTIDVVSNPLEAAALAFAQALFDASGGGMTAILAPAGIRLQLGGAAHVGLSSRQTVASLRDFLREYEGVRTAVTQAGLVAGSSDRGFAEIHWSARVAGTSEAIRRTLFVGLVGGDGGWRVDEVRFLP
ncbi:MAG: hypothetical protein EXR92_05210 [Gemmatimonadetes bacterium]|nr:hypothetical protein [Gemmatimonadota bacterium]